MHEKSAFTRVVCSMSFENIELPLSVLILMTTFVNNENFNKRWTDNAIYSVLHLKKKKIMDGDLRDDTF